MGKDYSDVFSAAADKSKRLIILTAADHVTAEDARLVVKQLAGLLADIAPGFRVLTDLSRLHSTDRASVPQIAAIMNLLAEKKVGRIVRFVPDPTKDIGLNILGQFHYSRDMQAATYDTLADAVQALLERDES